MPPRRYARVEVVEREEAEGSSDDDVSSSDASDGEPDAGEPAEAEEPVEQPRGKITLQLRKAAKEGKASGGCKVCGRLDHKAGFLDGSSIYSDCPYKPCYLCKMPGHTTATCPNAIASASAARPPAAGPGGRGSPVSPLDAVRRRESGGASGPALRSRVDAARTRWRVDAAVLKLHARRVTALEAHPSRDSICVSGDKRGEIAVWDFERVQERTVHSGAAHLIQNVRFGGDGGDTCFASTGDGKVIAMDLETGYAEAMLALNPGGWNQEDPNQEKTWRMCYGLDTCRPRRLLFAGDDQGRLHTIDERAKAVAGAPLQLHGRGSKLTSVSVNAFDVNLLATGGNDRIARLHDARMLGAGGGPGGPKGSLPSLASLQHGGVINAVCFSPLTGRKLMSTCQDNRLRVWQNVKGGDLGSPDELVHSHDFNRYLSPFKACWDPRDPTETLACVGRYISSDYGGKALHPIDIIDTSRKVIVRELIDPSLTTITPVVSYHPRRDVLLTASSRSLFLWKPDVDDGDESEERPGGGGGPGMGAGTGMGAAGGAPPRRKINVFDADSGAASAATKKKKSSQAAFDA